MESVDDFLFEDDRNQFCHERASAKLAQGNAAWKVLIVDDEEDVHDVTRMTLKRLIFDGRRVEFYSATSAAQAKEILRMSPDIAVILLDVVMEEEYAGLSLVHYIRRDLKNSMVRIILRTGHPGQAPEESVTIEYDINDYREKTELTTQRLMTAVVTALRSYRDLQTIDENRRDLKQVITSSIQIFRIQATKSFAAEVLRQLALLACLQPHGCCPELSGFVAERKNHEEFTILVGTGRYQPLAGRLLLKNVPETLCQDIQASYQENRCIYQDDRIILYCQSHLGPENIICIEGFGPISEWAKDLLEMLRLNILVAYDNIYLNQEIEATQRECILTLGEIAESRSPETGNHVKRVGEIARILALRYGLSEYEAELIKIAASMHDLGKLAIQDAILNKPGILTHEEYDIMKNHAELGYEMLKSSKRSLFQTAALIAREHHENYDGSGYPHGLKAEEINIYSRIVALADVFDALGTKRVYKNSWTKDQIIDYLWEQKGKKFDPQLVELFFEHNVEIFAVRENFPDE